MGTIPMSETPYFLVYQMGKVGSVSIKVSLQEKFGAASVKHTHNHDDAEAAIRECVRAGRPVVVITGFREPLARCMSAYFETFARPQNKYWFVGSQEEILGKSRDWLIADFNSKAPRHIAEIVAPWLTKFLRSTGLSMPDFDIKQGILKTASDGIVCYVYKLERLSDFAAATMGDAWIDGLMLETKNDGGQKWSGDIYRSFKGNFRITRSDYNSLYGGLDYVGWLYTEAEIEQLIADYVVE